MISPITPVAGPGADLDSAIRWIAANKEQLSAQLLREGVLLLRGFPVTSAADFHRILAEFTARDECLLNYLGGASPRSEVGNKIYTSTDAPAFVKILMHPEMSYLRDFPTRLGFYCETPSAEGGETPLADARRILQALPAELIAQMEQKQVIYQRKLRYLGAMRRLLGRLSSSLKITTWNHVYATDNQAEVEAHCAQLDQTFHWNADHSITTQARVPAVRTHPITGEKVWFNTSHCFIHERELFGRLYGPVIRLFRRLIGDSFEIYFGDGSEIPVATKEQILKVVDAHTWTFDWQQGDVLIIDNLLCWHGRNPFKGKRKILTGLIGKQQHSTAEHKRMTASDNGEPQTR